MGWGTGTTSSLVSWLKAFPLYCRVAFSALTPLVGLQEEHPPCTDWVIIVITSLCSATYVCWQRGIARIHTPLLQQSINIFCSPGPQQQTCSSRLLLWAATTTAVDKRTNCRWAVALVICLEQGADCLRMVLSDLFYRPDALPATRPTVSKHWGQKIGGKTFKRVH